MILGHTIAEGTLFADMTLNAARLPYFLVNSGWESMGPLMITESWPGTATQKEIDIANEVKDYYILPDGVIDKDNTKELIEMGTDALMTNTIYKTAELFTAKNITVYQYLFSQTGPYYTRVSSKSEGV